VRGVVSNTLRYFVQYSYVACPGVSRYIMLLRADCTKTLLCPSVAWLSSQPSSAHSFLTPSACPMRANRGDKTRCWRMTDRTTRTPHDCRAAFNRFDPLDPAVRLVPNRDKSSRKFDGLATSDESSVGPEGGVSRDKRRFVHHRYW
jgi:hypothetical protein